MLLGKTRDTRKSKGFEFRKGAKLKGTMALFPRARIPSSLARLSRALSFLWACNAGEKGVVFEPLLFLSVTLIYWSCFRVG